MSSADEEKCEFEGHSPRCNNYYSNGRNDTEDIANTCAKDPPIEEYEAKLHACEGWYLN